MRTFALIAEQQGLVEWTRDTDGQITFGRVIQAYGTASIGFGHRAELQSDKAEPATAQGEGEVMSKADVDPSDK